MKSIILILAIIGIICMASGYIQNNLQCPPPRIQYRYIDRTFEQEQNNTEPILSVSGMASMFPTLHLRLQRGVQFQAQDGWTKLKSLHHVNMVIPFPSLPNGPFPS